MVGIVSSGIGSGLDVNGLVRQLVAAEGQPVQQRLALRESQFQAKLSGYGSLKSALENFKSSLEKLSEPETVAARTISASVEDVVTTTVDETAVPATYTVDILNTAAVERLTSAALADADTVIGTGTLTLSIGDASFDVTIDDTNNTLAGIRDAINAADDNTGVQATIVNADGGSYLILSGEKTGLANTLTVTQSDGDGGLASLVYDPVNGLNALTRTQPAADATITVNGFSVTSETNEFTDVIDGVTFTALEATSGDTFTIDVANDTDGVGRAVKSFVDAYNALISTTDTLSSYNAETDVAGPLQGDAALRSVTSLIRRELSENTESADVLLDTLSEIGVSLDEEGKLEVDQERLDSLLASDFSAIQKLFSGDEGYAARLTAIVDSFTDSDGIITARSEGIESSIRALEGQNEALGRRLESLEARLFRQFNGLDSLLSQLNTTSSFLTAQLANLPTPGRNNS